MTKYEDAQVVAAVGSPLEPTVRRLFENREELEALPRNTADTDC